MVIDGFNPRPRASGRLSRCPGCSAGRCFNPRPRASGRPLAAVNQQRQQVVSIHARVRAGDAAIPRENTCTTGFNPRPRASGRHGLVILDLIDVKFQSTPACERATRSSSAWAPWRCGFNPRPRASGRRLWCRCSMSVSPVSIHARVRAGDVANSASTLTATGFQSTPACERATCQPRKRGPRRRRFNPRPRASGRRFMCNTEQHWLACFNPRPRASGRLGQPCRHRYPALFQSTPACERATPEK